MRVATNNVDTTDRRGRVRNHKSSVPLHGLVGTLNTIYFLSDLHQRRRSIRRAGRQTKFAFIYVLSADSYGGAKYCCCPTFRLILHERAQQVGTFNKDIILADEVETQKQVKHLFFF